VELSGRVHDTSLIGSARLKAVLYVGTDHEKLMLPVHNNGENMRYG
jgi:hypothetical protein